MTFSGHYQQPGNHNFQAKSRLQHTFLGYIKRKFTMLHVFMCSNYNYKLVPETTGESYWRLNSKAQDVQTIQFYLIFKCFKTTEMQRSRLIEEFSVDGATLFYHLSCPEKLNRDFYLNTLHYIVMHQKQWHL